MIPEAEVVFVKPGYGGRVVVFHRVSSCYVAHGAKLNKGRRSAQEFVGRRPCDSLDCWPPEALKAEAVMPRT